MAGSVVATAWVEIVPEMKGSQTKITELLVDEGNKAGTKGGEKAGESFSKGFSAKAGVIAGVASSVASKAIDVISGLTGEMIESSDSAQKFASTLSFAGLDTSKIEELTASSQKYADETIYGLSDIRSITSQLASNGVANYDKLAEAAGNLNAVAGGTADTYQSVGLVLTQTAGAGKLTTENWNQLANAIPGASGKIQQELENMGAYTGNFREAMANGEISAEEFNQAILNLGFTDVAVEAATSASTIEGATGNLEAAAVAVGAAFIDGMKPMVTEAMSGAAEALSGAAQGVTDFFTACENNGSAQVAADIMAALGDTVSSIGEIFKIAVGGLLGWDSQTSASASAADVLKGALEGAKVVIEGIATAAGYLADNPMIVNALVGIAGGALMISKAQSAVSVIGGISSNISGLGAKGAEAAAGLASTAAGETAAGAAGGASATQILACAVAIVAIGAGVALASAGLWLLANAATQITAAGPGAAAAMLGMVVAIAGLAAGAAVVGPALTAGAVGMAAFGVAVLAVGAGIAVASAGVALLAAQLPTISTYGLSSAAALTAIGAASVVASGGLSTIGAGAVVAAAGIAGITVALTALDAALVVSTAAVVLFGTSSSVGFNTFKQSATDSANAAKKAISDACTAMSNQVSSLKLTLPRISVGALPHFYMNGKFDAKSGSVPSVGVSWYAKGGLFDANSPTIIGVGDNTRYSEVAMPLSPSVLAGIGEGIASEMDGGRSTQNLTINGLVFNGDEEIISVTREYLSALKRLNAI